MIPRLPSAFLDAPIAHRALHDVANGRPENSQAAVLAAIEGGFGIEIDLQLSADQHAIVFHDYDMERLAHATGPVRAKSQDALSSITLRGGDEGIPSLNEVLKLVAGRVPLLIELKDQDGAMGKNVGPLETATASALADYSGPVAVMSFNPNSVAKLAALAPHIPRGLVTCDYAEADWPLSASVRDRLREIPDYDRAGASFLSHQHQDLGRQRVKDLKASGADILCWTIRSPKEAATALQVAQNITFEGYLPD